MSDSNFDGFLLSKMVVPKRAVTVPPKQCLFEEGRWDYFCSMRGLIHHHPQFRMTMDRVSVYGILGQRRCKLPKNIRSTLKHAFAIFHENLLISDQI